MAIAAASSAYSIYDGRQQAAFQEDVAKQNADLQNEAADKNYKLQNSQLNLQELQESEAAALEKHRQKLAVQKEVAVQRVASGESGVGGISIDSIFADVVRQGANNITTIDRNLADSNRERHIQKQGLQNNTWASYQNPAFYKNKYANIGAGLQIASAAASGYAAGGGSFGGGKPT